MFGQEAERANLWSLHFNRHILRMQKYARGPAYVPKKTTLKIPSHLMDKQIPEFVFRDAYYPSRLDQEFQEWHKLHRAEDLWGLWAHTFFKLVPPAQYFPAHPEYYAFVNGERRATQLCLSNDEVVNITVNQLRKLMKEKPDALYWSISPQDGVGYCTCDRCATADKEEDSHAGSLIRFVNKVAVKFPDRQFTTLAYNYTIKPPKKTRPASNVIIMLSSIAANRNRPLSEDPSAAEFRDALQGWKKIVSNIFIWDYTTQFSNYLAPFLTISNCNQIWNILQKTALPVFSHKVADGPILI